MTHAFLSLKSQQLGHSRGTVICRYSTVENLEVTIRTAHGESPLGQSSEIYVVPLDKPFQGSLQGASDSMTNWAIVDSEIIGAMRDMGHGVAFRCAITDEKIYFPISMHSVLCL